MAPSKSKKATSTSPTTPRTRKRDLEVSESEDDIPTPKKARTGKNQREDILKRPKDPYEMPSSPEDALPVRTNKPTASRHNNEPDEDVCNLNFWANSLRRCES